MNTSNPLTFDVRVIGALDATDEVTFVPVSAAGLATLTERAGSNIPVASVVVSKADAPAWYSRLLRDGLELQSV
jgi:hypothetical protein